MYYAVKQSAGELSDNAYRLPRDHKLRIRASWSERAAERRAKELKAKSQGGFAKYCGITFIVPVGVKVRYSSSALETKFLALLSAVSILEPALFQLNSDCFEPCDINRSLFWEHMSVITGKLRI